MTRWFTWYCALVIVSFLDMLPTIDLPLAHAASIPSFSSQDFQRLDALITSKIQAWHLPGLALSIVQGDQVVHSRGFGAADASGQPISPQTPFVIGSISKPLTATAVMQLVEQGKIVLDAPIQRYLPWLHFSGVTPVPSITVRQLLTQTSGIAASASLGTLVAEEPTLAQELRNRTITLDRQPGTTFEYANFNYQVLGLLVEVVSGEPYAQYIQEHLFAPLGMTQSFTSLQDAAHHDLAQANTWYFGFPGPLPPLPLSTTDDPSGNLIASAGDLSQFLIAQLNGGRLGSTRLLSAADITAMQTPAVHMGGEGEREGYGLGWFTGEYLDTPAGVIQGIWHGGSTIGYNSLLFVQPEQHWGVVLLFNINSLFINTLPFDPSEMLKQGVIQMLSGMTPTFYPGPSLQTFYLVADLLLVIATVIVLWPLVRLPRWQQRFRKRYSEQQMTWWRWLRLGVRLAFEVLVPLLILLLPPFLLHLPFQALPLILLFEVPDFGGWLLVMLLVLFTTGVLRGILTFRTVSAAQLPRLGGAAIKEERVGQELQG